MNNCKNKKVAIVQSNYTPWKGYFDRINMVDEFILYDNAQYTKRDWRNRNIIKTENGLKWLTIPVNVKGRYLQSIKDVRIVNNEWAKSHLMILKHNYLKASSFKKYYPLFEDLYLKDAFNESYLSKINILFIKTICRLLDINTKITFSSEYNISKTDQSDKIIEICRGAKADSYLTGPLAKRYLDEKKFSDSNIGIEWFNYDNYLQYEQIYPPFHHNVSIVDLIFNKGDSSINFLKSKKL